MANKMTNKEMFNVLIAVISAVGIPEGVVTSATPDELIAFLNGKVEQLDKKANTVTKADKAKAELNAAIANDILTGLATLDKPVKISDLIKGYEPLSGYSTQKLTPIMTKLVTDGKVIKSVVKRETIYSLA